MSLCLCMWATTFRQCLVCSPVLSVQQRDQRCSVVCDSLCCLVLFPPGCVHSSPCSPHAAAVSARPFSPSWVKTYSSALSGQLIMDFDYSHFVLLRVAPLPEGGPAERPAPLIVSVFGPNWAKWERLLPKFALLLCLHADSPERHSLADSLKTPVDTLRNTQAHAHKLHSHSAVILMKCWTSPGPAHSGSCAPPRCRGIASCLGIVLWSTSQEDFFFFILSIMLWTFAAVADALSHNCVQLCLLIDLFVDQVMKTSCVNCFQRRFSYG